MIVMRYLSYLLGSAAFGAISVAQATTQSAHAVEPINVLLDQARFWHGKGRDDLAEQSLKRVLISEPNQRDALYYLSLYAAKEGKAKDARAWADRFAAIAPADPRIPEIDRAIEFGGSGKKLIDAARKLAARQDLVAAVSTYRSAFENGPPPEEYAAEFYQTLAGTEGGWDTARVGLAKLIEARPNDSQMRFAYARVLSYLEATRRDAISILSRMDGGNSDAAAAQRQALLWLDAAPGDADLYRAYLVAHPNDAAVAKRLEATLNPVPGDPGALARQAGFTSLKAGDPSAAQSKFSEALSKNPEDADALGGVGLTALRSGRYEEAETKLARAIELAPTKSGQWDDALSTARFYGSLKTAEDARRAGDLAKAEKIASALSTGGYRESRQAQLLYADILARQSKLAEAETAYRRALKTSPNDPTALTGLANVLNRQGKTFEADALLANLSTDELAANPSTRKAAADIGAARAKTLAQAGDASGAARAYENSIAIDPTDPWIRLDYARLLAERGDESQAQGLMASLGDGDTTSPESLYAAAIFEQERGRSDEALAFLQKIPVSRLTADMKALSSTVKSKDAIAKARNAAAMGNMIVATQSLQELAADPRSSVKTRADVAQALYQIGQTRSAVALARQELARGGSGKAGDYFGFLDVLTQSGYDAEARTLLQRVEAHGDMDGLGEMKVSLAVAQADRLRARGRYADAYDVLAVAMRGAPENDKLLSATGRLYQSGGLPKQAQQIYDLLLERNPQDPEILAQAADAALAAHDVKRADRLIDSGLSANPRDPRLYLLRGRAAEARGDQRAAQQAFRTAQQLRAEELGVAAPGADFAAASPAMLQAENPFRNRQDSRVSEPAVLGFSPPPQAEFVYAAGAAPDSAAAVVPARYAPMDTGLDESASSKGSPVQVASANVFGDPLTREIDQHLETVENTVSPSVTGGLDVRSRSGEDGLSKLTDISGNLSYGFSPFGTGRLKVTMQPVVIDAGSPSGSGLKRFGTNPLAATPPSLPGQQSSGVGLNLSYTTGTVTLDAGVTPLGFKKVQPVGGLEWRPQIGDYSELQVSAERRAVTDSVLSYAGANDLLSGRDWGAVVKSGGRAGYSYDDGDTGLYASGAYRLYDGSDVQDNSGLEINAGGYIRPYRNEEEEFRVGFNTNFLRFKRNLRYFTFGQGGYFSPQQFVSVSIPVSYEGRDGRWGYRLEAAPGLQYFREDASPYFPTDPTLQGALMGRAAFDPTLSAFYSGQSKTGFGIRGGAEFTYALSRQTFLAASVKFDNFGDYNETSASFSLKHTLGR